KSLCQSVCSAIHPLGNGRYSGIVGAAIADGPNVVRVKEECRRSERILRGDQIRIGNAVFADEAGKRAVIVLAGQLDVTTAAISETVAGRLVTIAHAVRVNSAADLLRIARISIHIDVLKVFGKNLQQSRPAVIQVFNYRSEVS